MSKPLPAVDFLKIPEQGDPYLEAHKCGPCGSIYLDPRNTCAKCSARGQFTPTRLSNDGHLYVFSVVYRSFPGVDVPYISAIVYKDALGRKDREGNSYLSYFFEPR